MSLRSRLLLSIAGVLLMALVTGGALACWQARKSVETEMTAALASGALAVHQSLRIHGGGTTLPYIGLLVSSFDGQRHLRAVLLVSDRQRTESRLAPYPSAVPGWFVALINVPSQGVRIPLTAQFRGGSKVTLVLKTEPGNEIGEVWNQMRNAFAVLVLFCGGISVLISILVGHALRSLATLQAGLRRISDGQYETALPEYGPPEFRSLAGGFNRMAVRLRGYAMRNAQLQEQLVKLQEEERAWIAHDLHDEVGPYLFAIRVDAEALPALVDAKNIIESGRRVGAIREAVAHIQKHIRAILRQLRPVEHLDFGLDAALHDAIDFWQRRYSDVRFDLDVSLAGVGLARSVEEVIYRIVRESVSNAVRHARPKRINVSITCSPSRMIIVNIVDDGDGLPAGPLRAGLGLEGMAARVRELNGSFEVGSHAGGGGVRVMAMLPLDVAAAHIHEPAV